MDRMVAWALGTALAAPVESWLDAVVLVQQGSTTCAAVHVGAGRVATAYHCVAAGGRPLLTTRDGARVKGRILSVQPGADLALLEAQPLAERPSLELALSVPEVGSPVFALGHPFGEEAPTGLLEGTLRWSVTGGVISAVGARALQVSAPLNPGNSGGPLVDEQGRVVGIASRRLSGDNLGFAVRSDRLPRLEGEGRGLGPLGGTLALHGLVLTQTGGQGIPAAGARLELANRDAILLDASAYVPWSPRFTAARFGAARSAIAEARAGARLRLGRGPWTLRLDGLAGIAALQTFTASEDDPFDLRSEITPSVLLSAQVQLRTAGFELGWMPEYAISRASVILRWPGVFRVF